MSTAQQSRTSSDPVRTGPPRRPTRRSNKTSAFHNLPIELPQQIFRLVLPPGPIFYVSDTLPTNPHTPRPTCPAILLVCARFHAAAILILYGERIFALDFRRLGLARLVRVLGSHTAHIRRLLLVVDADTSFLKKYGESPDWLALLAGSNRLYLVIRRPEGASCRRGACADPAVRRAWRRDVKRLVRALGAGMPGTARVWVDDDGEGMTEGMAERVFGARVRFVRTRVRNELAVWREGWDRQGVLLKMYDEKVFRDAVERAFRRGCVPV